MSYFEKCTTLSELTAERNRLAKRYHPDVGGSVEIMQAINASYERAKLDLSLTRLSRYNPDTIWQDTMEQFIAMTDDKLERAYERQWQAAMKQRKAKGRDEY